MKLQVIRCFITLCLAATSLTAVAELTGHDDKQLVCELGDQLKCSKSSVNKSGTEIGNNSFNSILSTQLSAPDNLLPYDSNHMKRQPNGYIQKPGIYACYYKVDNQALVNKGGVDYLKVTGTPCTSILTIKK